MRPPASSCATWSSGVTELPRVLSPGIATGEVLLLDEPLSLWGGLDPATGRLIDVHHPQVGAALAGRVVAMPAGRGSSSSSYVLAEAAGRGWRRPRSCWASRTGSSRWARSWPPSSTGSRCPWWSSTPRRTRRSTGDARRDRGDRRARRHAHRGRLSAGRSDGPRIDSRRGALLSVLQRPERRRGAVLLVVRRAPRPHVPGMRRLRTAARPLLPGVRHPDRRRRSRGARPDRGAPDRLDPVRRPRRVHPALRPGRSRGRTADPRSLPRAREGGDPALRWHARQVHR